MTAKKNSLLEGLANWTEIDSDGSVTYKTTMGDNDMIHCHLKDAPMQRVCLIHDLKTGRISLWNLEAKIERRTFRQANNTCAEELRFDLRQIALDGAKVLKG